MTAPLLAAFAAALCFGVASVLQQVGAERAPVLGSVHPRSLLHLARQLPFSVGLALDLVGFALSAWAFSALPLFVAQTVIGSSLAVTAVLAARWRHEVLGRRQRLALVAVTGGLLLSALAGSGAHAGEAGPGVRIGLAVGVVVLAAVAALLHRSTRAGVGTLFGALAGCSFAGFSLSAHSLAGRQLGELAGDPATWCAPAYLLLGLLLYGTGLQRDTVTAVTGVYVALETALPAVLGLLLFRDALAPAREGLGLIGVAVTVAGVVALVVRREGARVSRAAGGPAAAHP